MVVTHGQKGEEFSGLTVKREPQSSGCKAEMMSCTQLPCSPCPRSLNWRHPSKITVSILVMTPPKCLMTLSLLCASSGNTSAESFVAQNVGGWLRSRISLGSLQKPVERSRELDTNPPLNKTSTPPAAVALESGQDFGEKVSMFSYPGLTHWAGDSAGLSLRHGGMRDIGKGGEKEKVAILPYSPQSWVTLFYPETSTITLKNFF